MATVQRASLRARQTKFHDNDVINFYNRETSEIIASDYSSKFLFNINVLYKFVPLIIDKHRLNLSKISAVSSYQYVLLIEETYLEYQW